MNIQNYGAFSSDRNRTVKRKIKGIAILLIILLAGAFIIGILTDDGAEYRERYSAIEENHALKEQIINLQNENAELQNKISVLEATIGEKDSYINSLPTEPPEEETVSESPVNDRTMKTPRDE